MEIIAVSKQKTYWETTKNERKTMRKRLQELKKSLHKNLIGREKEIRMLLLSLLAGENIMLVGPPGTAKSEISRRLQYAIKEPNKYFEYLLTRFTTPEELFGPLSLRELENDTFKRKTEGYLSDSNVAFLDETFKASSSILNTILTIINERIFHNGSIKEKLDDFICVIGASNDLPVGKEELLALYDRFLIRTYVNYLDKGKAQSLLLATGEFDGDKDIKEDLKFTIEEIKHIKEEAKNVKISSEIMELIIDIKDEIDEELEKIEEDENLKKFDKISDRRFKKAFNLLKVSAYTNNKDEVNVLDLSLLSNCFWSRPENIDLVEKIVYKSLSNLTSNEVKKEETIYDRLKKDFLKFFNTTKHAKNKKGQLLYINKNGEKTTEENYHLKYDKKNPELNNCRWNYALNDGDYLYKNDHDFYSTDKEPTKTHKMDSSYNAVYIKNKPFKEAVYDKNRVSEENLTSFKLLETQVKYELNESEKILNRLNKIKTNIGDDLESHLWIDKEKLNSLKNLFHNDYKTMSTIYEDIKDLLKNISEAIMIAEDNREKRIESVSKQ